MVIILGIDALDPYIVEELGLEGLKQQCHAYLTIPDDVDLHTEVIWPTIITGVKPQIHGLTRTNARRWKNPFLQLVARIADAIIPLNLLMPLGRKMQLLGFEREARGSPKYYGKKGLQTIFSNTRARVVGVPGYSPSQKTDQLRKLAGHSTHVPTVAVEDLIAEIENEFSERSAAILEGMNLPVNMLMVYIYSMDVAGHIFWDNKEFIKSWYHKCEDLVRVIRSRMSKSDFLIIVSDHGMERGEHRRKSFFSCSIPLDSKIMPTSILEFKPLIEWLLSKTKEEHQRVRRHLESLGYM